MENNICAAISQTHNQSKRQNPDTSMDAAGDGSLSSHCPSELGWADLSQVFMEEINLRL